MTRALVLLLVAVGGSCWTQVGDAGPISGNFHIDPDVKGLGTLTYSMTKDTVWKGTKLGARMKFKGGRRACVVVMGDHEPVVPILVEVYDEEGKLVAADNSAQNAKQTDALGNDLAAAIWYPPRDAYYKITVKVIVPGRFSRYHNELWIAVK